MSFDEPNYRDLLEPQDALAGLITVLGVAILIFLDDSIVKLIGGCIAVLGGVALYMTLKTRMNDRIQIRPRRTTLPTPEFKTHVTTDPTTSAKRIRFDDFQETFGVEDTDEFSAPKPVPQRAVPEARPEPVTTANPPAPSGTTVRFDDLDDTPSPAIGGAYDYGDDENLDVDEGFRILPPSERKESTDTPLNRTSGSGKSASKPVREEKGRPAEKKSGPKPVYEYVTTSTDSGATDTDDPATPAEERTVEAETTGDQSRSSRKKRRGKKRRSDREPGTAAQADAQASVAPEKPSSEPQSDRTPDVEPESLPTPDPVLNASDAVDESQATESSPPERRAVRRQIQMVFEELSEHESDDESTGREPRVEFVRLVNQVLKGLARSIDSRSIHFFWVNLERGHFIPEASVTRGEEGTVRLGERIGLGNDLVSQIARGGVPEIVTNISPASAAELTPYYSSSTTTSSFVGVPVFFRNEVVGVLAADSASEEGFDESSVATLAESTILISQLIGDYAEKFDLYLVRRSIEAFESLNDSVTGARRRPREVAQYLIDQVIDMFDADYVAAILYDRKEGAWRIVASGAQERELKGRLGRLAPDMATSTAGDAARRATEIYLPSVTNEVLVAPGENLLGGGSFLAIPLIASSKCYGSLVLGNSRANAWVSRDVELMRDLTRYAAMAIEVINTNDALEEQLVFDEQTGLFNARFFMSGFEREVDRARDFKATLSLALVRVEIPEKFGGDRRAELSHTSITEVGSLLTRKVRPYDLVARFDDDTFGIALVGRSDQEAYLWAERLRKEIAGHIIPFGTGSYSVTISAGVCNATDTSETSNVLDGARKALEKAGKDGGNGVVIY